MTRQQVEELMLRRKLCWRDVWSAVQTYADERDAATERGRRQREDYEAGLRVRGYTEDQIRRR